MGEVVRLPTAARRQVKQRSSVAIRAFRADNPWPGEYVLPVRRDAACAIAGLSAAEIIVTAMLANLPDDQREAAVDRVYRFNFLLDDPVAQRAAAIAAKASGLT